MSLNVSINVCYNVNVEKTPKDILSLGVFRVRYFRSPKLKQKRRIIMITENFKDKTLLPPYIAFPRFLLGLDISETSKIIFALLLDRARLSQTSDTYKDDNGKIYVYFTLKDLAQILNKSENTIKRSLKVLEKEDLITKINQGFNKPNKIFIKVPKGIKNDTSKVSKTVFEGIENDISIVPKTTHPWYQNCPPNNNEYINNKYNNNNISIFYGEYNNVSLNDNDFIELEQTVPNYDDYIEKLSSYMASTGRTYKNHAATIKSWALRDKPKNYDDWEREIAW